jgi:hypothetical protein
VSPTSASNHAASPPSTRSGTPPASAPLSSALSSGSVSAVGSGEGVRVVVPADVDTPDRIAWGLTFRQLAILAAGCGSVAVAYSRLGPLLPQVVWAAIAVAVGAVAIVVALGRRDGLPLDVWIRHGLMLRRTPALAAPGAVATRGGGRGDRPVLRTAAAPPTPAPLRPEVTAIAADGTVTVDGGGPRAVVACGTTGVGLRTGAEQAGLLDGFGRWLNSLTSPVQIVVSAARHDLTPHAHAVLDAAPRLPHPALRDAAIDYAEFLTDLDTTREPLRRQVLTVLATPARAETRQPTVRALTALGVTAHPLDGPAVVSALAAAANPYRPPVPGPRAVPGTPITSTTASTTVGNVNSYVDSNALSRHVASGPVTRPAARTANPSAASGRTR